MINIADFKNKKKLQIVAKDLAECQKRLSASIELLKDYGKYIPVMESLSTLHNSRTLIEIHLNKYRRTLEQGE